MAPSKRRRLELGNSVHLESPDVERLDSVLSDFIKDVLSSPNTPSSSGTTHVAYDGELTLAQLNLGADLSTIPFADNELQASIESMASELLASQSDNSAEAEPMVIEWEDWMNELL